MERPEDVLRRLGDPTRLRVLTALLGGRRNVSQIVADLGLSQPQVSYHLRLLREAGLATEERDGRWVWYEANWSSGDGRVREVLSLLAAWTRGGKRASHAPEPSRSRGRRASAKRARAPRPARGQAHEVPSEEPDAEERPQVERPAKPASDLDDFLL